MVSLTSLAVPILLSAVIVFVASAILHMVVPMHRNDLKKLAKETDVLDALRKFNIPPGDYAAPQPETMGAAGMKSPEFIAKMKKGPLVLMTIAPGSEPSMGPSLAQWFVYCLVVNLFAGYIASRALPVGAHYLSVFRFVGATAFMAYGLGMVSDSIWFRRNWGTTIKSMIDGLIYGLLAAGTFGWLWPR